MILLVYPKVSPFPYSISTPLSIFCIGSYLEKKGMDVEYYDERIHNVKRLMSLLKSRPLLVGISSMTGYQIKRGLNIADVVRRFDSTIPIVWGGVHPTMCTRQTMESRLVDFVIKGEGEETLFELVKHLVNPKNTLGNIAGLVWKENGQIYENKPRTFLNLNMLPFPYIGKAEEMLKDYIKVETSRDNMGYPTIGYQITRGCPYHCTFCYNSFFYKSIARHRKREVYFNHLTRLKDMGIRNIYFYDINLGINKKFIFELTEVMKRLNLKWIGGLSVNWITPEIVRRLEDGGCDDLFLGIEAMKDSILKRIKKPHTVEQAKTAIHLLAKSRIKVGYSFIDGLPYESSSYIKELIESVDEIRSIHPNAELVLQPFQPLPGTFLFQEAVQAGFVFPKRLPDCWNYTTGSIVGPWVKNRFILLNLYLISFLLSRCEKTLKSILYLPFHIFAKFRWKHRFFKFCFERLLFTFAKSFYILRDRCLLTKGGSFLQGSYFNIRKMFH